MKYTNTEDLFIRPDEEKHTVHWHTWPELLYQMDGYTQLTLSKEVVALRSQDIFLINSYTMHSHTCEYGHLLRFILNMPKLTHLLGISPNQYFLCDSTQDTQRDFSALRRAIAQFELLSRQKSNSGVCTAAALQIMLLLLNSFVSEKSSTAPATSLMHLQTAIPFMEQHFQEHLTIRQIAGACHLSETHLAYIFKQELGITPWNYLTSIRLNYALSLLENTSMRVSEIAEKSGFSEPRQFNASFRTRFGLLPREWRIKKTQKASVSGLFPKSDDFEQRLLFAAAQIPPTKALALTDVDVRPKGTPIPEALFNLLCAGQFSQLLEKGYKEQLREFQNSFHFKTALISNPFVSRVLPYIQDTSGLLWDFSVIDDILDFMLSIKLKPILSLSCIPDVLSSADSPHFGNATCDVPKDMEQWQKLIKNFFTHLIHRYGSEELACWHCSIGAWQENMPEKILDFYFETVEIIRKLCPYMPLGSPNIENTADDENLSFLQYFLDYCKTREWQPDFYLFYSYPGKKQPVHPNDDYADMYFTNSTRYIKETYKKVQAVSSNPVYITWNSSPTGCGNYFNDTTYKAANLIPSLLDIAYSATGIGYSIPFDTSFFNMAACDFDGSFGLITRHGLPKASFFALLFLRQLEGNILLKNDHCCVTKHNKKLWLLSWNHQELPFRIRRIISEKNSLNYLRHPQVLREDEDIPLWTDSTCRHTMLDSSRLLIELHIHDLISGPYMLTEQFVNDDHGCAYSQWLSMGSPALSQQEDVDYLKRLTVPGRHIRNITINDSFGLRHLLMPNEIYLAVLERV